MGYYHLDEKDKIWNEQSPGGQKGEMAQLVYDWENAAVLNKNCGTRQEIVAQYKCASK